MHTNYDIKNSYVICRGLRYDIYNNEIKKCKNREMDARINKMLFIRTSFMQDIENNQWKEAEFCLWLISQFSMW